ncbi:diacylglycerol kinase [Kiloniella antarctica]|uniref:Diacylglycerol kinase n=1 Tax=Kiloniella antarctica TaxID=1550907 RepID=A0ABW5BJ34_9PROT
MAVNDVGAVLRAFRASLKGLLHCLCKERAFQQELLFFIPLSILAIFVTPDVWRWLLLTLPLIFVLIVEVLNTGLEAVVDRVGLEHHELSGVAKDCGSAAVLLAMFGAVLIWGAYFFEYLFLNY